MPTSSLYQDYANHLGLIATFLTGQQEAILVTWRFAVDHDGQLKVAAQLGKVEFEGQISGLLQFLNREILSEQILLVQYGSSSKSSEATLTKKEHSAMREHGLSRWQHGYEIGEMVMEWSHMNLTLVRLLNEYEADALVDHREVNSEALATVRLLAAQLCDTGYIQSVTEYQRLQGSEAKEVLESLSHALERMVKWEKSRGEVLREAIHDLRGNLSTVQVASSLLDTDSPDLEIQESVATLLQRGIQSLQQMMNELLDLSRLEAGKEERHLENFDAACLIRELCQSHEPLALDKGLRLSYEGPEVLEVEGDVIKVGRVAQNLLLNALKYTCEGSVTIKCSQEGEDFWRLSVEDTGPGLSHSQTDATRQNPSGEGVGLMIVKRLCVLLEAQLEIDSSKARGTTFHVIWPRRYGN